MSCSDKIPPPSKCEDLYPWAASNWAKKHAKDLENFIRDEIERQVMEDIEEGFDKTFIQLNQE